MSKPESICMWDNVSKTIQRIESQTDLFFKTTDLYYPQYCYKNNKDSSLKSSHIIGEFVRMKKSHDFIYGFKSQCTPIHDLIYKLEGFLRSIQKNKSKTFSPFGNEFLPTSKNITLTDNHIMYPMRQKDICDYDPRCIMYSGLIFYDIIMYIIRNNKLAYSTEENDCLFTQIKNNIIYMYMGSLQDFY